MTTISIVFSVFFLVSRCLTLSLDVSQFGTVEPARLWSILSYLQDYTNADMASELYPIVTNIEEYAEDSGDITGHVVDVLRTKADQKDLTTLLSLLAELYPMGFPIDPTLNDHNVSLNENCFFLNEKKYNEPEDIFYLKSDDLKQQASISDSSIKGKHDIVIGNNLDAPIVILYGCPDGSSNFDDYNRNIYREAIESGKLRFIWRPTCPVGDIEDSTDIQFPLSLTVKKDSDFSQLTKLRLPLGVPHRFQMENYEHYIPCLLYTSRCV